MTPKGHGAWEVAVTYFMTPKLNLTYDLDFDLGYNPKSSRGHKMTYFMTPKFTVTFMDSLT